MFAEDWLLEPRLYWQDWGKPGLMTPLVKFYYKLGFSAYAFASLSIFFEPKQKDFVVMVAHHMVTLVLITLSYLWPYYRVGTAILFLHDLSDPVMELAKMALYAGRTKVLLLVFPSSLRFLLTIFPLWFFL